MLEPSSDAFYTSSIEARQIFMFTVLSTTTGVFLDVIVNQTPQVQLENEKENADMCIHSSQIDINVENMRNTKSSSTALSKPFVISQEHI